MEDIIELYKKRDALAKENADASDITNIINEKLFMFIFLLRKFFN